MAKLTANGRTPSREVRNGFAFVHVLDGANLGGGTITIEISRDGGSNWSILNGDTEGTDFAITGNGGFNATLGPLPFCHVSARLAGATSPDVEILIDSIVR